MKIIITGGLGYVGGRLSKFLAEEGHDVIALSRQANSLQGVQWPNNLTIKHPDEFITHPELLKGADVFIHMAALNENDCVKYPAKAIDVNIAQTLLWLDMVQQASIKKFIYFSTAHVYAKPLAGYYDETTLTRPIHPYAITHKSAEDYVLAYTAEKQMSNLVIRLTNSFGGPAFPTADRWTLLVNDLCRSAVATGKMTLLSDGLQLRDFICLHDVCAAISHLIKLSTDGIDDGIFNLSAGESLSVWDMSVMIKRVAEGFLKRSVELIRKDPGISDDATLVISNKKLLQSGFMLQGNTQHEIESTLQYFKEVGT